MAGLVLLAAASVIVVTRFVDPNRFKGRIETAVREATGYPFRIDGDLDLAWFPWLAVQMGPGRLGQEPLMRWKSVRVGAQLIPLLHGRLVISRVRLEGLHLYLRRARDGETNWDDLFVNRGAAGATTRQPQEIGGVQIREGALEYLDERNGTRIAAADWMLDASEWRPGKPFALDTRFVLQIGAPSTVRIPIAFEASKIEMQSAPAAFAMPEFELSVADARLNGAVVLQDLEPLQGHGKVSVQVKSLRKLLADLAIRGPLPRDRTTLGPLRMTSQWVADQGAVAVKPIELELDQTKFNGELSRSNDPAPLWAFNLRGDRIALERYTDVADTSGEPFELPTAALRAMRAQGVLSFDEAQLAQVKMKNLRLRVELTDGRLHEP